MAASQGRQASLNPPAGDRAHPRRFLGLAQPTSSPTLQIRELQVSQATGRAPGPASRGLLRPLRPSPASQGGGLTGRSLVLQDPGEAAALTRDARFLQESEVAVKTPGSGSTPGGRERSPGPLTQPPAPPAQPPCRAKPGARPVPGVCTGAYYPPGLGFGGGRAQPVSGGREKSGRPPRPSPSRKASANAPASGANRPAAPSGRPGSSESAPSGAGARAREAAEQDPRMPAGGNRSQSRAASQPRPRGVGTSVPIPGAADPRLTRPDLTLRPDPVWIPGPAPVPTLSPLTPAPPPLNPGP